MTNTSAVIAKKLTALPELMLEHFISGFEVHFTRGKITYMKLTAIDPQLKYIVPFNAFRQALEKHFKVDGLIVQRVLGTLHDGAVVNYIHEETPTSIAVEYDSIGGHVFYDMRYLPGRYGDLERLLIATVHSMETPLATIDE